MNKITKNKIAKGLVSLVTIIVLLSLILAGSLYYKNNITGSVAFEDLKNSESTSINAKEVNDVKELNQLNEGWYKVSNGYVFYLETFDSYVPLYIRIKNPEQQNIVFIVDADGNIKFEENFDKLISKEIIEAKNEESTQNLITGLATGLERVSGFATVTIYNNDDKKNDRYCKKNSAECQPTSNTEFSEKLPPLSSYVCEGNNCRLVENRAYSTTSGTKASGELTAFVKDNTYYRVVQDSNNILVSRQESGDDYPTTLVFKKELLGNIDWSKRGFDGSIYRTGDGATRDIDIGQNSFIDTYKKGDATIKTVKKEFSTDGQGNLKLKKETINDLTKKEIKETTFADNSKIEIIYEKEKQDLTAGAKVIVTADGKTSQMNGKVLLDLQLQNPELNEERRNQLLSEAVRQNIKIEVGKDFIGDKKGVHLEFDNEKILTLNKDTVTRQLDIEDGTIWIYTGEVTYDAQSKSIVLSAGSTYESLRKDKEGKTTSAELGVVSSDGEVLTKTTFDQGTTAISFHEQDEQGYWKDEPEYIFSDVKLVTDATSHFVGMYEFKNSENQGIYYYTKTNLGAIVIKDAQNKDATIFSLADKNALANSVDFIREKIEAKPTVLQEKTQSFFATFERIFSEFRGLRYIETLFFDEDSLLAWRDNVDRAFATLFLGTEYWSSTICSTYLDGEARGIAYAETPQGLAQVGAHIEATRTEEIKTPTGREFIYKITFNIRNGDFDNDPRAPKEMNINVILKGEKTATVFKNDVKIKRGSSFGRIGSNTIVQDSTVFYNQVCIRFDEIPFRWKTDNNELCNIIQESSGKPTPLPSTTTTTTTGGGRGEDINDF